MLLKIKAQSFISVTYFLIAAFLGVLLRLFPVTNVDATYKFIVHTHSHIALLGWVYIALTSLIYHLFINKNVSKKYSVLFWITQVTILGMLVSFPITRYALFSIIFSTLFLICTYWFYSFFRKHHHCSKKSYSYQFINTSLLFLVISSIGPWALGVIMKTLGNTSTLYKNAIYFYLHFQYNGWFIFCLLGLFIFLLEKHKILINKKAISLFYKLLVLSCCLTLFLSFLWIKPSVIIYVIAFLGSVLQLFALFKFQQILNSIKLDLSNKLAPFTYHLLQFIYILFVFKIVLQAFTAIPLFAELVSQIIDFVIGYLHLTFLGIVSLSLFIFLKEFGLLNLSKFWIRIYLLGFILSEILIFYKGFCNWQQLSIINNYYVVLVTVSALIPIAVLGICIQNFKAIFSTPQEFQ
ncbi:hypothetical protein [Polaribacter glomeratus]|uniref:Cytochrome oxidase subunit I profile domain-containing protein n=1 Tax=Polaribacter glomeratus TaxID=102 RepID=A0A2S7WX86_9FLAO|nr:hypothetical protein [Polaribacter glomeratus]PQJ82001.1 hypothetical protein BTO16_05180 [Polaribacter glomeratus]TXD66594.1 hypothetical protein ESX12_03490 [Polaribacter glomeratus]